MFVYILIQNFNCHLHSYKYVVQNNVPGIYSNYKGIYEFKKMYCITTFLLIRICAIPACSNFSFHTFYIILRESITYRYYSLYLNIVWVFNFNISLTRLQSPQRNIDVGILLKTNLKQSNFPQRLILFNFFFDG